MEETKHILLTAGAFDWEACGIFDSKEDLCNYLRWAWDIEGTDEEILDSTDENEFRTQEVTYYNGPDSWIKHNNN